MAKGKYDDLTGHIIGQLKIITRVGTTHTGYPLWECECRTCGKTCYRDSNYLRRSPHPTCTGQHVNEPPDAETILKTQADYIRRCRKGGHLNP